MTDITKNTIKNPPEKLSMLDVMGTAAAQGGFVKSCRFYVRIVPQGALLRSKLAKNKLTSTMSDLSLLCEAAEMPGRAFMNLDGRYYGPNFKIPFQTQYEDTPMTFLCRSNSYERRLFDDWMEMINPTNRWDFAYRDHYTAQIHIYQLAEFPGYATATAPFASYQWTLHDAFPVLVNPQQNTWADDNFQRLTISFTYTKWTRPGLDMEPKGLGSSDDFIKGSKSLNLPPGSFGGKV